MILIWLRGKKLHLSRLLDKKSPKAAYDEEVVKKTYNKIISLLVEERFFLNKNLKVSDLASKLNQNEKIISRSINRYGNGNFNAFVNSFRVEHAKELLLSGQYDHYTIEAIALESGFANKVSFYNAFKSVTGMSPKEFKAVKQP
ncbi:MAG: helix-turn-helix domain-containing protein [Bacteroidota bacterium]